MNYFKNQTIAIFCGTLFFLGACGQQNSVVSNEQQTTIAALTDTNTVVIDVRTPEEFLTGHLQKAVNVPYDEIDKKISDIVPNKNQTVFLYCRSGRRSGIALKTMQDMGYSSVINGGGYDTLKANGAQ